MGETNAERLVRIITGNTSSDQESDLAWALELNWIQDEVQTIAQAQTVLDILASWRTCGNCTGIGGIGKPDKDGSAWGFCENKASPCYEKFMPVDRGVCHVWEEKTDG